MTRDEFVSWALANGWTKDRYGHLQKEMTHYDVTGNAVQSTYRFKLQAISVRMEKKAGICGKNEWIRLRSNYFSKLSIDPVTGKLKGMVY